MPIAALSTNTKYNYLYTGKEFFENFGLNWYDHHARYFDPETGRWWAIDPALQMGSPYLAMGNNPVLYVDEDGEWFVIDDLIAGVIGGTINLTVNLIQGNIDNIGEGFAAFGSGFAAGTLSLYGPAGWAAGGAIVGATNSAISQMTSWDQFGQINWGQVGMSSFIGGVSGLAGGAAGQFASKHLGGVVINGLNITSPVVKGMVGGAIGGSIGGYAGGFTGGLLMTGNFGEAHSAGLSGLKMGAGIGTFTGGISGYKYARENNLNPWNGKSTLKFNPEVSQYDLTPNSNGDNVTLYRGTTGSEGKGALWLTDNPEHAQTYVKNGGHVMKIEIPRSTFLKMQYDQIIIPYKGVNSQSISVINNEFFISNPNIVNRMIGNFQKH